MLCPASAIHNKYTIGSDGVDSWLCQWKEVVTLTAASALTNNILVFQPVYRSLSVAENRMVTEAKLMPNYVHINICIMQDLETRRAAMGMKMEAVSADEFRGGQSAMGQSGLCNNHATAIMGSWRAI